ncbi:LPS translocon maturation chaperone LptM [Sideroxyarcus emersonii]|uniref:LPS translocon maturation chaperone LptM n=1 Tax=Sideroxyarcus emersonii TaxID=2764705 RepID=UPI001F17B5A0|nr:lipoprotein [Sideroxyarcus emersonii]
MKDKVMRIAGIMLLLTVILQGCGRKGPLFLPPPPTAAPAAAAQPAASQVAPAQPAPANPESKK